MWRLIAGTVQEKPASALRLANIDYGLADFATMVKLADDGLPLVCVAMIDHVSQLGILSLKDSNISKPKDLEGKTMGTTAGSADYALWPGFVAATGLDADKVKINIVGPELRDPTAHRQKT